MQMGPSGAGKTSVLKALTLDIFGKGTHVSGDVSLNGKPLTIDRFMDKCAIVEQEDYHWNFLTAEQTLRYVHMNAYVCVYIYRKAYGVIWVCVYS